MDNKIMDIITKEVEELNIYRQKNHCDEDEQEKAGYIIKTEDIQENNIYEVMLYIDTNYCEMVYYSLYMIDYKNDTMRTMSSNGHDDYIQKPIYNSECGIMTKTQETFLNINKKLRELIK